MRSDDYEEYALLRTRIQSVCSLKYVYKIHTNAYKRAFIYCIQAFGFILSKPKLQKVSYPEYFQDLAD